MLISQLFPLFLPGGLTLWALGSGGPCTLPPKASRLTSRLPEAFPQLSSLLPVTQSWERLIRYCPERGLFWTFRVLRVSGRVCWGIRNWEKQQSHRKQNKRKQKKRSDP